MDQSARLCPSHRCRSTCYEGQETAQLNRNVSDLLMLNDRGLYSPPGDFYIDPWLPVAVRFPRMARWRRDKRAAEADTLDAVRKLAEPLHHPPEQPLLF